MLKILCKTGAIAAAAGGLMLVAAPANAAETSGRHGILSGNQVIAPISIPVNVCGNAVAILGFAGAGCEGGASVG